VCAESMRDLGVIVDSGLTFDDHVNNVVSKAYVRISMLFRGFSTWNITSLRRAYTQRISVLSLIEYASNIWNPNLLNMLMLLKGFSVIFPSE